MSSSKKDFQINCLIYVENTKKKFHRDRRFKGIRKNRKGRILRKTSDIYDLIVKDINNNDYLMVKGSNSTGLNKIVGTLRGAI